MGIGIEGTETRDAAKHAQDRQTDTHTHTRLIRPKYQQREVGVRATVPPTPPERVNFYRLHRRLRWFSKG